MEYENNRGKKVIDGYPGQDHPVNGYFTGSSGKGVHQRYRQQAADKRRQLGGGKSQDCKGNPGFNNQQSAQGAAGCHPQRIRRCQGIAQQRLEHHPGNRQGRAG